MSILKHNLPIALGMLIGSVGGYIYYSYVGCNGSCLIGSSPYISTLYGAVMGGLFVNLFRTKKEKVKDDTQVAERPSEGV
jgi:hypothetical protein